MRALLLVVGCVAFVGCTFGAKTCMTQSECEVGATCTQGFCVGATPDSGSGGSVGGGGGGGSMGGGTGGGLQRYCDAGLRCAEWQECAANDNGGACADSKYELTWSSPDSGIRSRATTLTGELVLSKADGGVLRVATVPVSAESGTTAVVSGTQSPFSVSITLGGADGTQSFVAGWRDGGPVSQLDVDVDRTGPTFVISVSTDAGYGVPSADFLPSDPAAPSSFRKDEVVSVRVTTASNDVANVKLIARFGSQQAHEVTTSSNCTAGSGRCDDFLLDLSRVPMANFSGAVELTVEGADTLGNPGTGQSVSIPVTRWQWARRLGGVGVGALRSTPAIGTGGKVFVGVSNGTGSGVVAINPSGTIAWGPVLDGPVEGVVAVGRSTSSEWLFYNLNSGLVKSIDAVTGTMPQSCSAGASGAASIGGIALFGESTASVGSISLQPGAVNNRGRQHEAQSGNCNSTALDGLVGIQAPGNMVIGSNSAYYANSDGNLRRLGVVAGSAPTIGTLNQTAGGVGVVNGLAMLSGTRAIGGGGGGAGIGRLFAFDITASVTDSSMNAWPGATALSSPTSGPSVGGGGVFAQYRVTGRSNLIRVNPSTGVVLAQTVALGGSGPVQSSFTANSAPTPTLGNGNLAYVVDEKGSLFVLPQDFAANADAQWAVGLPGSLTTAGVVVTASPNLDCNRRVLMSQTGVLYIATETGWLVSYLVDSRGLDTGAPWPKYARDSRNTGNFDGPAVACP